MVHGTEERKKAVLQRIESLRAAAMIENVNIHREKLLKEAYADDNALPFC